MATTSPTPDELLASGSAALDAGAWESARSAFEAAAAAGAGAAAWEGLGWAGWWLADPDLTTGAREAAYRHYREAGDPESAARVAAWLSADLREFHRELAVARGWLELADRLLDGRTPAPAHGWVSVLRADYILNVEDDLPTVRRLCADARRLGQELGEPDLEAVALAQAGAAAVAAGDVDVGMRALDEASAIVAAEDLRLPISAGWVMCCLITACDGVGDFARAEEWCAAAKRFTDHWGGRQLAGVCRSSYGRVLATRGDWQAAERELAGALDDLALARRPGMAGGSLARLGELRARQGRTDEARDLFERAGPAGLVGLGELALDAGDAQAARDVAARALRTLRDDALLPRLPALELRARAEAELGHDDEARSALRGAREIGTRVGTPYLVARIRRLEGEVALSTDEHDAAREAFEDAVDGFTAHAAPYDAAVARVGLGWALVALDREALARREFAAARETLATLGAARDVQRLDAARESRSAAGVLTPRELDVLRLIAEGRSDHEVAEALVVSPHTVHRHVANIRTKLRQPSRAAAVAYAARTGLL